MSSGKRARTRTLVLGGIALLIVSAVAWVYWHAGGWRRSNEQGREKPLRSSAGLAGSDEIRTMISEARKAVGEGRFANAFDLYRRLDGPFWAAEDCSALGSALMQRDRIALGWAALEAARRIDPKHAETRRDVEAIQVKLATATGEERNKRHEAASRVEFLRTVPGGPPLGLLVLGLARFASDSDQEEEFLDRLGLHDRAALRATDSVSTATGLVARLLMEVGRAREAYDLLDSLISNGSAARVDLAHDAPTPDREVAWLLSRAALQLDQTKVADAMLARAGDPGKRGHMSLEPAPYVGSKRCGECHGKIYHEQQDQSRHALTLRSGTDLKDVPLPAHPVPDPISPEITHGFIRKGDDRIEMESRAGGQAIRAIVEYAVGSGRHGITMVAKDTQGIDRELRVSYFGANASWGETKGIDFPPRDQAEVIGVALAKTTLDHCLSCHTTWFRAADRSRSGPRGPESEDRGIGCERCHGPGLNHVKAERSGYADTAIAVGTKSPSSLRQKSCVECHAADGSVQPSDPEFTRAQGTTFLFSRCYTSSKDQFGCTTCHNPHRSIETSVAHYQTVCLSCHTASPPRPAEPAPASVDHQPGRLAARLCPVNATAKCISCHMPKVDDPSRRSHFTDHHIRIHKGESGRASLPR